MTSDASSLIIEFGSARDQALLGGSFHGPEWDQALKWNWIGDSPAWIVLPTGWLKPHQRYQATLEAAPFSPHNTPLQLLTVTLKGKVIHTETIAASQADLSEDHVESPLPSGLLTVQTSKFPPPTLDIQLNDRLVKSLHFRENQTIQPLNFDFESPNEDNSRPSVLTLIPGRALSSAQAFLGPDNRRLSFRLFRLILSTG